MTKTCGECKYFNGLAHGFCKNKQGRLSVQMNDPICQNYKQKPTNGDVIRRMSNEELAERFAFPCPPLKKHCNGNNEECLICWLKWLNAPADCVKQNSENDTQAYLCKADYTESEGKDD